MFLLVLRTLVVYVLIVAAMRLMGKKQLGELQPSELVSTILISNLASLSIESPDVPLVTSMLTVFLIVACETGLALCVRFAGHNALSPADRALWCGKASLTRSA
ncbi:MAG: hypothetical protein ACLRWF_08405 [Ruthenibacterium sp.]